MRRWNLRWKTPVRTFYPGLVLSAGLAATAWLAFSTQRRGVARANQDFAIACRQIEGEVRERLRAAEAILRATAAFVAARPHLSPAEWQGLYQQLQLERLYPGIEGVGFVAAVSRNNLAEHVATRRSFGAPDYHVHPESDRATLAPVTFLESITERNQRAIGYDLLTESTCRTALELAADLDGAVLTGRIRLVQETGQNAQAGALLVLPVFLRDPTTPDAPGNRGRLVGWVYCAYRLTDLFTALLTHPSLSEWQQIHLEVYDGLQAQSSSLLYPVEGAPSLSRPSGMVQEVAFAAPGRPWLLRFAKHPPPAFLGLVRDAWFVTAGGISGSLLLAGLLRSLQTSRTEVRETHEEMSERLQESEERLRLALEGTGDGIWDWNAVTGTVYFSPLCKAMLGYTEEEIGNRLEEWDQRLHPDDREHVYASLHRHLSGATPTYRCEHRLRAKDGSYRWILDRGRVISFTPEGKPLRVVGTHTDVTASNQLEESLRQMTQLLNQLGTTILITDTAASITYVNEEFTRLTGYSREEAVGRNPRFLASRPSTPGTHRNLWQTLTEGKVWRGEFRNRRKSGEIYWEAATVTPLRDPDGRIIRYVAVKQDVTAGKRMQEALSQAQQRLVLAVRAGHVGIWDYHVAEDRFEWNESLLELFELSPEHIAQNWSAFHARVDPVDAARVRTEVDRALLTGTALDLEFRMVLSKGRERDVHAMAVVERDESGRARRLTGTAMDITERRQRELGFARQLQKEKEVSEMKSRFIAIASHEFRTPMTAASASVDLLQRHFDRIQPGKRREMLDRVRFSMRRINEILDEVLVLDRLERQRIDVSLCVVALPELVRQLVNEIRLSDGMTHVFSTTIAAEPLSVLSDPKLLHHIVGNLLSNAVRYSPPGSNIHVRMSVEAGGVELSVNDEGIGIPAADRQRIFEPFERGSNVGAIQGTGIGLNIVKQMTELLDGAIEVGDGDGGVGTKFTVRFPLLTTQELTATAAAAEQGR